MREGRGRARAPRAAVLRRQGLDRAPAARREGVPPRALPVPAACTSTPATTSPEVIEFRDRRVAELGEELLVASVQKSIDSGRVVEERGPAPRRATGSQTTTLLDAIEANRFDACFGGARRDEERAAREGARDLATRRLSAAGSRGASAPSCGTSTTRASGRASTCACSRCRTGPSSTSGSTILREEIEVPHIYLRPRAPRLRARRDAARRLRSRGADRGPRRVLPEWVRYRTVGDMSCTGAVASRARRRSTTSWRRSAATRITERGETARRRPRGPRRHGGPQGCRLTSETVRHACDWRRPASVDDGKSTLIGRLAVRRQVDPRPTSS